MESTGTRPCAARHGRFATGPQGNVWVSTTQLSLQMTHQILQSLHLSIGARWERWRTILLHLQSNQPLFGSTDAGNDCRPLLFEFLQMSSRTAQERLAILHLLVNGHTLGLLSRRASMLRATHPLRDPLCRPICPTLAATSAPDRLPRTALTNGRNPVLLTLC